MTIEEIIYDYALNNNIIAGICSTEKFEHISEVLLKKEIPFAEKDIEKRINPLLTMPEAKSIIAFGVGYNKKCCADYDNKLRGTISIGAIGTDYHILIKQKLYELKCLIEQKSLIKSMIFTDTGPLVDREVAKRCGLGWQGKNCSIINKKFGSMFYIGYMLVDIKLNESIKYEPFFSMCGNCNKCIKACPNNALSEFKCNYEKCLSYLTQYKGILKDKDMNILGKSLYGCDICQKVCPYNYNTEYENCYELNSFFPEIEMILNISNREFKNLYGNTAMGWRGKGVIQRNAIIALGNIKNRDSLKIIEKFKDDSRSYISYTAKWALKKIKNEV